MIVIPEESKFSIQNAMSRFLRNDKHNLIMTNTVILQKIDNRQQSTANQKPTSHKASFSLHILVLFLKVSRFSYHRDY